MRETNLRGIDLNLLVLLDALIDARSVTRAAQTANLSQPAMSRALGRLRAMLGDPILVRGADGLVPTSRARALQPALKALLANVRGLLAPEVFDPAAWRMRIVLSATDHQTTVLLPEVIGRLSREAPLLDIDVVPFRASELAALRDGRVHASFGVAESPAIPGILSATLYRDRFVTLLRRGHPALANAWTAERFAALDHVLVTILGHGRGFLDDQLALLGLSRRVALRLPHFVAAMAVVARSDHVVTLPRTIALRHAAALDLVLREPPVAATRFTPTLLWPEALDADPGMRWLRDVIREEAARTPHAEPLQE